MSADLPDDIIDSVKFIQAMKSKTYLSREEKENLNRAKLRIAYWACRSENIMVSRENLTYVLGPDSHDIMNAYDKYLETASESKRKKAAAKPKKRGGTTFWDGAK